MTRLAFLSAEGVPFASPLEHVPGVVDVSTLGKLDVRGELGRLRPAPGEELIPITPARGLLVCDGSPAAAQERLSTDGFRVYEMTSALAGIELVGEELMRRLTELDLEALPAAGAVARGVPAIVERRDGDRFRLFVPRELGHYVAEVVVDLAEGLGR